MRAWFSQSARRGVQAPDSARATPPISVEARIVPLWQEQRDCRHQHIGQPGATSCVPLLRPREAVGGVSGWLVGHFGMSKMKVLALIGPDLIRRPHLMGNL